MVCPVECTFDHAQGRDPSQPQSDRQEGSFAGYEADLWVVYVSPSTKKEKQARTVGKSNKWISKVLSHEPLKISFKSNTLFSPNKVTVYYRKQYLCSNAALPAWVLSSRMEEHVYVQSTRMIQRHTMEPKSLKTLPPDLASQRVPCNFCPHRRSSLVTSLLG